MAEFERGNVVIGQSGGPTTAINATLAGAIKRCLLTDKIEKIYGMRNGIEGLLNGDLIEINDYFSTANDPELANLINTPGCALGSCRKVIDEADIEKIYKILEEKEIRYFLYIGGNDSMDTVAKLTAYAEEHKDAYQVNFIGIPKTIDNDLVLTDHTPGYGSAAKFIAVTMQEIIRDAAVYKAKAVTIVEIMGRDSGWLTAAAAVTESVCGVGPDLVYFPEFPFDKEQFINAVNAKLEDKDYVVIAVSEGIKDSEGNYVALDAMSGAEDTFGHKYLAGTGKYLENLVKNEIGCKVRSIELNVLQRCAGHTASATDLDESVRIGDAAVRHAVFGETGKMMVIKRVADKEKYMTVIDSENIAEIANKTKKVPKAFIDEENLTITDLCIDYILPLIQGEVTPKYIGGVPVHFEF